MITNNIKQKVNDRVTLLYYRDLLSSEPGYKMDIKLNSDGQLHVPGLTCIDVYSVEEVNQVCNHVLIL